MELRLLGPGDEPSAEAACRLFGLEGDLDPTAFLTRPEAVLYVTEDEGAVAGWVYGQELVHPDGERTMLLYALDVAEPFRRQGIGRQLVDAFVDHARDRGCTEIWVLTDDGNRAAIATYVSAGATRDPVDQVMFSWHLRPGNHS